MKSLEMEVADIRKINGDSKLKAFADLKIGGCVLVKGFSVVQGKNGVFVSMPSRASKDGKWFETFTPLSEDVKEEISDCVLEAYDREVDGAAA